jgi:hypothetical protein
MATRTPPAKLAQISPKAYEHPADRAATAALKAIPMLDVATRRLIEYRCARLRIVPPESYDPGQRTTRPARARNSSKPELSDTSNPALQ